jgi:hypothetical protein
MIAAGEITAAEAARLLEADPAKISELADRTEPPQAAPAPKPRSRPSTSTR